MSVFTALDLTGFTQIDDGASWISENGVLLSLHYFDLVPDLAAPLEELDALRSGCARFAAAAGGGLIAADIDHVDGVPALRQLIKMPHPRGNGMVFLGSFTVPKARCSAVIKVQAAEGPVTGFREAVVLGEVGMDDYFQPHPYAPDLSEGLPYHAADHSDWDARFPGHPLTLVRAALEHILPTVRLDAGFRALPGFAAR